jgi:hypothetical protein
MVRAMLRDLILSPDPRTLPGDPAGFVFGVQLFIGPADGPGEESFELTVCSPEWLAERCRSGEPVNGLRHVIVAWDTYDERILRELAQGPRPCRRGRNLGWYRQPAPLPRRMGVRELPSLIAESMPDQRPDRRSKG